jgi:hypothetical protein
MNQTTKKNIIIIIFHNHRRTATTKIMILSKKQRVLVPFLMTAGSFFMPGVAANGGPAGTAFKTRKELKTAVDKYCDGKFKPEAKYG